MTWEEEEKSEKQRDWDKVDGVKQEAGFSARYSTAAFQHLLSVIPC